jgi:hypothetical protein
VLLHNQGMPGVLSIEFHGSQAVLEKCLDTAIQRLSTKQLTSTSAASEGDIFRASAGAYRLKHARRPIIIIEINSEVSRDALKQLLLATKQLGFEEKLATFIVVVSASRSALGMTIGFEELRAIGYSAPDFDHDEARQYLVEHLNCSDTTASSVIAEIGTRAMHLVFFCKVTKGLATDAEILQRADAYRVMSVRQAKCTLTGFMSLIKKTSGFRKEEALVFFETLLSLSPSSPPLTQEDALKAFNLLDSDEPDLLVTSLAKYHAFEVDPFTSTVDVQSKFMRIAMEEYLADSRKTAALQPLAPKGITYSAPWLHDTFLLWHCVHLASLPSSLLPKFRCCVTHIVFPQSQNSLPSTIRTHHS